MNEHEVVLDLTIVLRRDDVLALWIVRADNRKTGIVAGAVIGLIIGSVSAVGGNEAVLAPAILGALGSTVGAGIGKRSPRKQLVYSRL